MTLDCSNNAQINDDLVHDGFTVVDLLDAEDVRSLREGYKALPPGAGTGFDSTILSPDPHYRRSVDDAIRACVTPRLRSLLEGHRVAFCTFAVKSASGADSEVPMHQDWSFVDERRFIALGLWCPLVDVYLENGCMQVVKGSHASPHPPRAACTPFAYPEMVNNLRANYLTPVPMKAGQALLFDNRLFHCSPANQSGAERVAATAVIVPEECKLRYYHQLNREQSGQIEVFEVEDSFYLTHTAPNRPEHAVSLEILDSR